MLRVGRHENIFILFLMAIKTAVSAQKVRDDRVRGNTAIFCLRLWPLCRLRTCTFVCLMACV